MNFLLVMEMLGLGLVSALGWLMAIRKVQDLKLELRWEKAKVQSLELDLARWSEKNSKWAKEMVGQLKSRTEMEKQSQSEYQMSESAKAQAIAKGWGWVLGQENSPKQ